MQLVHIDVLDGLLDALSADITRVLNDLSTAHTLPSPATLGRAVEVRSPSEVTGPDTP
jgi:hypothetical protein